jgi:hypothetical protein
MKMKNIIEIKYQHFNVVETVQQLQNLIGRKLPIKAVIE